MQLIQKFPQWQFGRDEKALGLSLEIASCSSHGAVELLNVSELTDAHQKKFKRANGAGLFATETHPIQTICLPSPALSLHKHGLVVLVVLELAFRICSAPTGEDLFA